MKTCYITYLPTNFDLRLALQDGKVLAHLPNYLRIFEEPPTFNDTALQLLSFRIPEHLTHKVRDGGEDILYAWAGDKGTRSNPQDCIRIELVGVISKQENLTAPEMARVAFNELPPEVKLAAIINITPGPVIDSVQMGDQPTALLLAWAENVLAGFKAQKV